MHLVDDIDLVARRDRRIAHGIVDLPDILDAVVRGGVDLHHIDYGGPSMIAPPPPPPRNARRARPDRWSGRPHGQGADNSGRRARMRAVVVLPTPRTPREHPGLGDCAPGAKRVRERAHHGFLADEIVKIARAGYLRARTRLASSLAAARRREAGECRLGFAGRICSAPGSNSFMRLLDTRRGPGSKPKPFRPPNPPGKQVGGLDENPARSR